MFVSQFTKHAFSVSARHNVEVQHIYFCYATSKYLEQIIGMDTIKISKTTGLLIIKKNFMIKIS